MRISDWSSDVFSSDLLVKFRCCDPFRSTADHMTQFPSLRVRNFRTISKPQSVLGKAGDAELPQAETRRRHFDRLVEIGGAQSGCCHLQKYVPTRQSRIEPRQWRFRQNRCMIFLSDDPRTGSFSTLA